MKTGPQEFAGVRGEGGSILNILAVSQNQKLFNQPWPFFSTPSYAYSHLLVPWMDKISSWLVDLFAGWLSILIIELVQQFGYFWLVHSIHLYFSNAQIDYIAIYTIFIYFTY